MRTESTMGQRDRHSLTEEDLELRAAGFAMILGVAAAGFLVLAVAIALTLA